MDCNTPGFPVLHYLPELAQIHVHWVSDAIQSSHPLLTASPPALNLSSIRVFSSESSLHQVAKVLELQYQFFQWIFRVDFLQDWLVWLPFSQRDSEESSPAPKFKSITSWVLSLLYGHLYMTGKTVALSIRNFVSKVMCLLLNTLSRFVRPG